MTEHAEPLDGAVEVDWQRPLDEWETAFKDELFLWSPFFKGLGHSHIRLDANAKYALARIAGVLHRAEITRLEAERDEANDEITDPWLCGIIRGLEWRASELEAEVATLREAAQRLIDNAGGLAVSNASARQLVQIEDVRSLTAALASPRATAREGEPSE